MIPFVDVFGTECRDINMCVMMRKRFYLVLLFEPRNIFTSKKLYSTQNHKKKNKLNPITLSVYSLTCMVFFFMWFSSL